ncbi:MAG: HPr(Ser) kinase/phosphatase [Peptoniphilaceae bacterium]
MDSIKLKKLVEDLSLEIINESSDYKNIEISSPDLISPGLQLIGYNKTFSKDSLLIINDDESGYLERLDYENKIKSFESIFKHSLPAVLFFKDYSVDKIIIELAKKHDITLLKTKKSFSKFAGKFQNYYEYELAPSMRKHGVLLDVYGVGVLITGKSGIGKSETALDLISKGSKLISDDSVIIKKIDDRLIGASPPITKYFMEIRGVGIIDVQRLFGIGFVMESKEIEMIVNLETWDQNKEYERLGLDNDYEEILGKNIVKFTIPVKPGRHTALIIEVATKNFKQKEMGYNAAVELNNRIFGLNKNKRIL